LPHTPIPAFAPAAPCLQSPDAPPPPPPEFGAFNAPPAPPVPQPVHDQPFCHADGHVPPFHPAPAVASAAPPPALVVDVPNHFPPHPLDVPKALVVPPSVPSAPVPQPVPPLPAAHIVIVYALRGVTAAATLRAQAPHPPHPPAVVVFVAPPPHPPHPTISNKTEVTHRGATQVPESVNTNS
jgi:hypothetical protein